MRMVSQFPVPNVLELEKKYQKQHAVKSKLDESESPESQNPNRSEDAVDLTIYRLIAKIPTLDLPNLEN